MPARILAAVIFFSLVVPSLAQSDCDQQIIVNVRDTRGEFVSNLAASSFRLTGGGGEATVSSASASSGSKRVIVILDASGSMRVSPSFWQATKSLAEQVVHLAPSTTEVGLVILSDTSPRLINFGHPRKELIAAIEQLSDAKGRTPLWDSLANALEMFGQVRPGDSILLISDGGDNLSHNSEDKVEKTFMRDGVRLFLMSVRGPLFPPGAPLGRSEEERVGAESLERIATASGGDTSFDSARFRTDLKISDPSLVLKIAAQFLDEASHYYIVHVHAKQEIRKPKKFNLSILATDSLPRKGVRATYFQQLLPCAP